MLAFFHALNAVLWFDEPATREVVILDPQWIMDAVTSIVRDYTRADHTEAYARMALLDQRAQWEQPAAWDALTKGSATLTKPLLDILWDQEEFRGEPRQPTRSLHRASPRL